MSIQIERQSNPLTPKCKAAPKCFVNFHLYLTSESNVDFVLAEMKKGIMGAWSNFEKREKADLSK